MRLVASVAFALLIPCAFVADAQDKKESNDSGLYKVVYSIRDAGDVGAKARRYTMMTDGNSKGTLRVGSKIPYSAGASNWSYADVGVNIESRLRELSGKVLLNADFEISSVLHQDKSALPNLPVIASTRLSINAMLDPGKPAVIASIDDPVTQHHMDLEATITRVN